MDFLGIDYHLTDNKFVAFVRLICDNRFQGSIPAEFEKLKMLVEIQYDENLVANVKMGADHLNRKFGHW